ncbi:hypothetical protein [Microcystis phage Mvi-JY20]|uniref:Uncharacterized protein n=1 Tax=Microcystis phage Mvi-JY20 TaxID=3128146 RepID=A0AAX4QGN7_9CAUD
MSKLPEPPKSPKPLSSSQLYKALNGTKVVNLSTTDPTKVFTYDPEDRCVLLKPLKASAELRYENLYGFTLRAHLNAFFSIQRYTEELASRTHQIAHLRNAIELAGVRLDFLNNLVVHSQRMLAEQADFSDEQLREFILADNKEVSAEESREGLVKQIERILTSAQSAEVGLIAQKNEAELRLEELLSAESIVPRTYGLTPWEDDNGAERYIVEGVGRIAQSPNAILHQMVNFILSTAPKIRNMEGEGLSYQTEEVYTTEEEIMDSPFMQRLYEVPPGEKDSVAYQILIAANLILLPETQEVKEDPKEHSVAP